MHDPEFISDVIIAGAGPAGIAAALAAADQGATVLLFEKKSGIGGTVTHTGIFSLCGFFPYDAHVRMQPPGTETARWASAFATPTVQRGKAIFLPVSPWKFTGTACRFLEKEPRITLMTNTPLVPGLRIRTGAMVDCTGNGGLAGLVGLEIRANRPACPGLGFLLHGIRQELLAPGAMDVTRMAFRVAKECSFQLFPDINFTFAGKQAMPGMLNLPPEYQDFPSLKLLKIAMTRIKQSLDFLRAHLPAMKHAVVVWTGSQAGRRAGPVIAGIERLDLNHPAADSVCITGTWPAEQWYDVRGACFAYPAGKKINIPDGCLTADFPVPFFMAGRCISATAAAQSAVRVVGTCLETGHRAGLLAARAAQRGHHEFIT